jgi:hypothetical protein
MSTSHENTTKTTYAHSQEYKLTPGKNKVSIKLITAEASFSNTEVTDTLVYGSITTSEASEDFTLYANGKWVYALVTTEYDKKGTTISTETSYCHMYFKPDGTTTGGAPWIWAIDAQQSDNRTIFVDTQIEHQHKEIVFQLPTVANPPGSISTYPNLNPSVVFLLDKKANGNMLFRGNEPLDSGLRHQKVDFQALHNALKSKHDAQTTPGTFPAIGKYILRDIAFLDHSPVGELQILLHEIASFGATEHSQVDEVWYPTTPTKLPSGMIAQVTNWDVEPGLNAINVKCVKDLSKWMDTQSKHTDEKGNVIPVIYYIHCSSGHDRTGVISSGYLIENHDFGLSKSFILGTSINKITSSSGNLVKNCDDITTGNLDTNRSRCFVAGSSYNSTVESIYKTLKDVTSASLSTKAVSGDPAISNSGTAYVYAKYPWEFTADEIDPIEDKAISGITVK